MYALFPLAFEWHKNLVQENGGPGHPLTDFGLEAAPRPLSPPRRLPSECFLSPPSLREGCCAFHRYSRCVCRRRSFRCYEFVPPATTPTIPPATIRRRHGFAFVMSASGWTCRTTCRWPAVEHFRSGRDAGFVECLTAGCGHVRSGRCTGCRGMRAGATHAPRHRPSIPAFRFFGPGAFDLLGRGYASDSAACGAGAMLATVATPVAASVVRAGVVLAGAAMGAMRRSAHTAFASRVHSFFLNYSFFLHLQDIARGGITQQQPTCLRTL